MKVNAPEPAIVSAFPGPPETPPMTVKTFVVLFVHDCEAPSATFVLMVGSAPAFVALSVIPPVPIVSVFAPPIVTADTSSSVNVRLRMEKSAPSCVVKFAAPKKLKNTSSALPGMPPVPLLKSGDEDQFVPPGPVVVFHSPLLSPAQ